LNEPRLNIARLDGDAELGPRFGETAFKPISDPRRLG
jgi:hypothetical protein